MAKITEAHYHYDKYKNPDELQQKIQSDLPSGYHLNLGLSNSGVMVVEGKDNKRVISVKGTQPTHGKDILSDIMLSTGMHKSNIQFRERKNEIKNIMRREPDKEYYLTGHSLGSSILAQSLASSPSIQRKTKKAYLFNQGSTPLFEAMLKPRKEAIPVLEEKVEIHKYQGDPISKSSGSIGTIFLHRGKKTGLSAHSISNFT